MFKKPFECKRCNSCCYGQGGIYFNEEQLSAASDVLHMGQKEFLETFCREKNGRYEVICTPEGSCSLLGPQGCRVQEAKPDVCRRWPYFEALLMVPGALEEAKLACPGINSQVTRQEFLDYYDRFIKTER